MPQMIAMQPPVTAAAMPTATVALASAGSVSGKAPMFAGLLMQLGCTASPPVPGQATAPKTNAPGTATRQTVQPDKGLPSLTEELSPETSAAGPQVTGQTGQPASVGQTGLPAGAGQVGSHAKDAQQSAQAEALAGEPLTPAVATAPAQSATAAPPPAVSTVLPQLPAPAVPQSAAPAAAQSASATLGPGQPVRERAKGAAHSNHPRQPADSASANLSNTVSGTAPMPTPLPATPPPTTAPEPPQPRRTPGDSQAEAARLEGVAAKPGPTAPQPAGNAGVSDPPAATATSATSPAWPSSPAPVPAASASPVQPAVANAGPAQLADPVPVAGPANAATAPHAEPASAAPGQQVSSALMSLAGAPGGGQRMTLRLEPADLGQVQIRIDRPQDGPAQVEITVQRPETLTLLLRDQPQLERALDQAGVPPDGRSLTLHVAPPSESVASSSGGGGSGIATSGDTGQGGSNGAGTRSGGQGQTGDAADQDQDNTPTPLARWLRAGLDITA